MTQNEKRLTRRYLIWCYKSTKEELDKTDRYFTQLSVDQFLLKKLKGDKLYKSQTKSAAFKRIVKEFEGYMKTKEGNVLNKKFVDGNLKTISPEYAYLHRRFQAIEKAIIHFFDKKELLRIQKLYEQEMTRRILEAREHR